MNDEDAADTEGSLSKRSRNATIPEADEEEQTPVKTRENSPEAGSEPASSAASPVKESEGVRQVTKGVKEVELEDEESKAEAHETPLDATTEDVHEDKPESPTQEFQQETSVEPEAEPAVPRTTAEDSIIEPVTADKSDDIASSEPDSEQTAVRSSPPLDESTYTEQPTKLVAEPVSQTHNDNDLETIPRPSEA